MIVHFTEDLQFFLEVVLSLLVESFKFSLSDKEILHWKTFGIMTPTIVGDPVPKLPIIIERA